MKKIILGLTLILTLALVACTKDKGYAFPTVSENNQEVLLHDEIIDVLKVISEVQNSDGVAHVQTKADVTSKDDSIKATINNNTYTNNLITENPEAQSLTNMVFKLQSITLNINYNTYQVNGNTYVDTNYPSPSKTYTENNLGGIGESPIIIPTNPIDFDQITEESMNNFVFKRAKVGKGYVLEVTPTAEYKQSLLDSMSEQQTESGLIVQSLDVSLKVHYQELEVLAVQIVMNATVDIDATGGGLMPINTTPAGYTRLSVKVVSLTREIDKMPSFPDFREYVLQEQY